ncbi:NAD(P)/FAD-dependent oxidoreductase [Cellvibrio sp. ARAG 10.3]|uniref:NAD(P)/FAD-dependent oxidoreductase n=1 Tax=Cellvibrio sp. ARAG 10.3 TaxID=3451358 RepID=UPI003F467256
MFDVIILGGSYSGMAAALQLARGRRSVLVIDAGIRRNRFASASHGLLGQDGKTPDEIASNAKAQLLEYPNVTWRDGTAVLAEQDGEQFVVTADSKKTFIGKRLILALGVRDEVPAIPGLKERWGQSVFHCPYCHGYELNNAHLGVIATSAMSMHQALMIPDWGITTFFTNGVFEPDEEQRRQLAARNVSIERELISDISGRAIVTLRDGRMISLAGLFVASQVSVSSPLAQQLGCELEESPLGFIIKTDALKETSIRHVFACGDAARAAGNVTFAIADGVLAGTAAHRSLMFEGLH